MNVIVELILFYLLYRFIAGFLIPLFQAGRQMRQQFQNMNNPSDNRPGNTPQPGNGTGSKTEAPKSGSSKVGEYIDFEEVK